MTTSSIDAYGVVVGVDGSRSSRGALRWAADWAHTHDQQMQVIGAVEHGAHRHTAAELWQRMVTVLEREVAHVSEHYPRLRIDKLTTWGSPHRVLAEASRNAWTVVVGSRGLHPTDERVPGSVSCAAVSAAYCPSIVVPARLDAVSPGGPVVLGSDGSPRTVEATAFAFACASRLQVPLVVVNAGPAATAAGGDGLVATLAGFERVYPSVEVTMRAVGGDAAAALCSAAADATLIVVGGGSDADACHGGGARLELLHRARRPLAFVGAGAAQGGS